MEVFLYNSTVCRLCGEENDNGTLLYSCEENNQSLCEIINSYLPIKVSDDGELPRTICPGCTIQLEATVEFLNLIISGQKILRELYQREKEYKKSVLSSSNKQVPEVISEKIIYEINTSNGVYQVEHPISLQVSGLDKPKRKRGRPPKKQKSPEELAQESEKPKVEARYEKEDEERSGKRRRKTPTRFREAVQGKELERIFIEEGVIDDAESDQNSKADMIQENKLPVNKEPQVIGHLEASGELVVVVKGKGRGRPKGRMRQRREECAICGMEFSSTGRYMSHIAQHGPVLYKCDCGEAFTTKLLFSEHQKSSEHTGRTIVPYRNDVELSKNMSVTNDTTSENSCDRVDQTNNLQITQALPDLSDIDPLKIDENDIDIVKSEVVKVSGTDGNGQENNAVNDNVTDNEVLHNTKGKVKIKCNHCDKTFSNRQSKSLHIKAVHLGEKAYACVECGARFAYPRSLALHRHKHRRAAPHQGYACDLCGKVLNHPSSVVYHKQAEHAAQRYVCGACGKHFRHKQLLQRHQLVHSQARPFTCKVCNATFKTKANLLNHQLLHSGVKKFSCEICKHKFAHKTSLTLHMRWHTGVKPFTCGVCGKSFSQKGNLSEHERIHTGEKPYQCSLCPRRFTTSSQHRLHARRHLERAHACARCGKRMASRSVWAAHVRRDDCVPRRPARHKVHKQISLLVNDKNQQQIQLEDTKLSEDETTEERVIYVAYETEDSNSPAFHILDAERTVNIEENKVVTTCELYTRPSLLVPQPLQHLQLEPASECPQLEDEPLEIQDQVLELDDEQVKLENQLDLVQEEIQEIEEEESEQEMIGGESIPVTDERGNPLHFTMADGTKLAITSIDGKSLQVITQDGQTIPVEINGYDDEEDSSGSNTVVHQLNLQKTVESTNTTPVTHYFTIV